MKKVWDEAAIRRELANLDMQTGLNGAQLPIKFNKAKCTLGSFSTAGYFTFSQLFFWNLEWVDEEALDTIRHEYAHYMDYTINGFVGHGPTWKECCIRVGASPRQHYCQARADYFRKKHIDEELLTEKLSVYGPGMKISHPTFGIGVITEVEGSGPAKLAVISFESVGCKKMGLSWVDSNCKVC